MEFENYVDLETMKEIILNAPDYEGEVDLCMLFDLKNNKSCYLEVYNGELDLCINKHYNNDKYEYDNMYTLEIEPNLNSMEELKQQLTDILNKQEVE